MGKKNKKDKKGKGKEKTEQKAERKAEKRSKKELAGIGEEDIERLIAEFQEEDKKRVQVIEEKCLPPSPRCNVSLVCHPEKEELLLFGGEYFTGNKMFVYNDLFSYQIKKNEWVKVAVPNAPPPRSAHQAVTVPHQGGQMWVFGGEFSSHSQSQFYHYKDFWLLHLRDRRWEQIKAPRGPSARSGHRMTYMKRQIFIFGGFHDNVRDYKYYNDVYSFHLDTYTWLSLDPPGTGPSARSGCVFLSVPDTGRLLVYGGYSKVRVKKDVDKGTVHTDMFALVQQKGGNSKPGSGVAENDGSSNADDQWKWQPIKQKGLRPSPRSGMTATVGPGNKAFLFGGVCDQEDDDESLEGVFFDELWSLELEKATWFPVKLRGKKQSDLEKKKRRRKKEKVPGDADGTSEAGQDEDEEEEEDEMEVTQEAVAHLDISPELVSMPQGAAGGEDVFTVTMGQVSTDDQNMNHGTSDCGMDVDKFWPSKRMNTALAVRDGTLFLYSGIYEDGDRQLTLADLYSLDLHKMEEWSVLVAEDRQGQEWEDSDSSGDEEGAKATSGKGAKDEDSDDDSDESMEITFDDAPTRREGEGIADYFERSKDYWIGKAQEICEEDGDSMNQRQLLKFAKEICDEACCR